MTLASVLLFGFIATDVRAAGPPRVIAVFSFDADHILVAFDDPVTLASSQNPANYILEPAGDVTSAQRIYPRQVRLTVTTGANPGDLVSLQISGVVDDTTGMPMAAPDTSHFHFGLLKPSDLQAPDPTALAASPCVDRSRFAGPDSLPGHLLTVIATCVGNYNGYRDAVLCDTTGAAPRAGIQTACSHAPLIAGLTYRVVGRVYERNGNTILGRLIYTDSLYVSPPPVSRYTITGLSPTTLSTGDCDPDEIIENGEDYEGSIVRLPGTRVWRENPYRDYLAVGPPGSPTDTMGVVMLNQGNRLPYDLGTTLNLGGMIRQLGDEFVVAPRDRGDLELLNPELTFGGLPLWVFGPGQATILGSPPHDTLAITGMAGDGRDGISIHLPPGSQSWSSSISMTPQSQTTPLEEIQFWGNGLCEYGDPDLSMFTASLEATNKGHNIVHAEQQASEDANEDNKEVEEKVKESDESRAEKKACKDAASGGGGGGPGIGGGRWKRVDNNGNLDKLDRKFAGSSVGEDTLFTDFGAERSFTVTSTPGNSPMFDHIRIAAIDEKPLVQVSWHEPVWLTVYEDGDSTTTQIDAYDYSEVCGPTQILEFTDIGIFMRNANAIRFARMLSSTYSVSVIDGPESPVALHVLGNPAVGRVQLRLTLSRPSPAEVTILDVAGRRLAHWSMGNLTAGAHTINWDGRDTQGRPLRSGIVFAKVQVGGQVLTSKVVRLR